MMTPEQMRIAIHGKVAPDSISMPNYPEDLNAMREAIMTQPNEKMWLIFGTLANIASSDVPAACASASEWAETFCRVFWPERFDP